MTPPFITSSFHLRFHFEKLCIAMVNLEICMDFYSTGLQKVKHFESMKLSISQCLLDLLSVT